MAAFLNRPDHLARAASELARWDEVVALAARTALDPSIPVTRVEAVGADRTALLTDPNRAAMVAATLKSVVVRLRPTP
jgi:hypothetical protein